MERSSVARKDFFGGEKSGKDFAGMSKVVREVKIEAWTTLKILDLDFSWEIW